MSVVQVDRNGLEVLDEPACLALLRSTTIGRVAITVGALPTILPVNYRFVDGAILFARNGKQWLDAAGITLDPFIDGRGIKPGFEFEKP